MKCVIMKSRIEIEEQKLFNVNIVEEALLKYPEGKRQIKFMI